MQHIESKVLLICIGCEDSAKELRTQRQAKWVLGLILQGWRLSIGHLLAASLLYGVINNNNNKLHHYSME